MPDLYRMNKESYKKCFFLFLTFILFDSCTIFNIDSPESIKDSPPNYNYRKGKFVNSKPTEGVTESFFDVGYKFMFENNNMRKPNFEIPTENISVDSFANKKSDELSIIWLGMQLH